MDIQICKLNIALFIRAMILLAPVMLLFYQDNGLSAQELFFFQGLFYLTSIIFEIPIGYLSDTIQRKNLLFLSFLIFLVISLLWLFYSGYYIIMIGEILFAISKVMLDNSMSGYLYDYLLQVGKSKKMVKYYGYLNFYLALGTAVAAILGTFLYAKYGGHKVLLIEAIMTVVGIILVLSCTNLKIAGVPDNNFKNKVVTFVNNSKNIFTNKKIEYHTLFSGILTSLSILFALSFQPLMNNALFPIFMFGVISFTNHGIRALSGFVAGKWLNKFDLHKLIIPLMFNYVLGFLLIFGAYRYKNMFFVTAAIFILCLIIGVQLIFTILHISRLHRLIPSENRGNLMSVNNLVSRSATAVILLSSKFLVKSVGFESYYMAVFIFFIVICSYIAVQTYKVREYE